MNILWPEFCNSDLLSFDPMLDMQENLDSYSFEMQLPAENKEDFQILIEDKYLFITDNDEKESQKILFSSGKMEKKCNVFLRTVPLPCDVDKDNIKIDFKDGVLYINIKKKEICHLDY